MMQYKPLCEVKLMHEYFLTRSDGSSPFTRVTQKERLDLLEETFRDSESVDRDLKFELQPDAPSYAGQIKLVPSYSGFRLLVKTKQSRLADNTIVYEPAIPMPSDLDLFVMIYKNGNFDSYTNTRVTRPFHAAYIFSNDNQVGVATPPYLTRNISPQDFTHTYEQGELVSFGSNNTRSYYRNNVGDQWMAAPGNYFVNESDRLLAPLRFYYSFMGTTGITNAEFVLKNKNGVIIKSIFVEGAIELQNAWLDFSDQLENLSIGGTRLFNDMQFTLQVRGNNGFTKEHHLYFNDSFQRKDLWAVVHIRPDAINNDYDLFFTDGFMLHRIAPDGSKKPARIFEIPVKSRAAYWRFRNNSNRLIADNPLLNDYLDRDEQGLLISKIPKSISQYDFKLTKDGVLDPIYLPNPVSYDLNSDAQGRFYFDIVVPDSDMFPAPP